MDRTIFISGPEPKLDIIHSDVWLPGVYSRRVLCFELPSESSYEQAIGVIEKGLKSLVQGTPELGGTSVLLPAEKEGGDPWRAIRPHKGIELVVKDLRTSYKSFKRLENLGFPISEFKDQELLPIEPGILDAPLPVLKIQLNLIEGGILMGFCACHHLSDGNGMNSITLALGEECKCATSNTKELPPCILNIDRSILKTLHGSKTDISQHPAYSIMKGVWLPHPALEKPEPDGAPLENGHDPEPDVITRVYRLDHEWAAILKADASKLGPISTHDAISAMMWRTLTKARHQLGRLKDDQMSTFTVPANARKYVGLPKDWVGNCTYFIASSFPVSEIVEEGAVPKLAFSIRAALNKVDEDTVGGLFEIRKPQPFDLAWWPAILMG